MDCIFCRIIAGELPSNKVYEDEKILAFRDIAPISPVHVIVVPKIHMDSLNDIGGDSAGYACHALKKLPEIAAIEGTTDGYRVVSNIGENGGQSVRHLHFHIIGGKKLGVNFA